MRPLVLDTNVALDLLVFADDAALALDEGFRSGQLQWLATSAMRDELARVLGYPQIAARMAFHSLTHESVIARFDSHANIVEAPAKAPVTCSDPDDQKFIDLAVERRCLLLSKDAAVLTMARRLAPLGCEVRAALTG